MDLISRLTLATMPVELARGFLLRHTHWSATRLISEKISPQLEISVERVFADEDRNRHKRQISMRGPPVVGERNQYRYNEIPPICYATRHAAAADNIKKP